MSERLEHFKYLMEDRELTARAAEIQPLQDDLEIRRLQAIAKMYAEKAETSHDGSDPTYVFGEEGAAVCAAFIDRMSADNFPGSQLLENELTTTSRPGGSKMLDFWRPPIGRLAGTPYKIRGYKVGEVGGQKNSEVYLCEDGKLRAYTPFLAAATDQDKAERCLVHNLPIDTVTTRLRPVVPIIERHDGGIIHGLDEVLLTHMSLADS